MSGQSTRHILLLLLLLLFRNYNIICTALEQGLYPPYDNKSLNQGYIKDFVREIGSEHYIATLPVCIPTRTEHAQL
jgi:hypothetical protein